MNCRKIHNIQFNSDHLKLCDLMEKRAGNIIMNCTMFDWDMKSITMRRR
ncbi:MAG: hypothetical protein Q4F69_05100 [Bacteroidia bacterium]|nr:hypothetical protein [Bacteroidia bacterium]